MSGTDLSEKAPVTLWSAPGLGVPSAPLGTAANPLVVSGSSGGTGGTGGTSSTVTLAAGSAQIGTVSVAGTSAVSGTVAVSSVGGTASVAVVSLPALPAGANSIGTVQQAVLTPSPPATSVVATAGVAVTAFAAGACGHGYVLKNPGSNTGTLLFNEVSTAGTVEGGTTLALAPGQSWFRGQGISTALSVNAPSNNFTFSLVVCP